MTTITLQTAKAGTYADATEADLYRVVHELDKDRVFVVVRRQPNAEEFAQAMWRQDERRYTVEYTTKSGRLQQTRVDSADDVHAILAGWAFNRNGWRSPHTWTSNTNDDVVDLASGCDWSTDGDDQVVTFLPFGLTGRGPDREAAMASLMLALQEATRDKAAALEFSQWASNHVVKRSSLSRSR